MEELETHPEGASPEQETAASPEEGSTATEQPEPVPEPEPESELIADEESEPGESSAAPISIDEFLASSQDAAVDEPPVSVEGAQLMAVVEAIVYLAEEPLTVAQIALSLQQPQERIREILAQLIAEFEKPEHGVSIREVAGGYKMATKPEHHDTIRNFVKSLKAPLKLSLPALETLAVIAYKQPVTTPEIMEIRGVQGGGVLKTLLDRRLITEAGRKNVIGKPILYKTTKEFLIQFGLKDLSELPSLKEFEEIRRMSIPDVEAPPEAPVPAQEALELESASGPQVVPAAEPAPETDREETAAPAEEPATGAGPEPGAAVETQEP